MKAQSRFPILVFVCILCSCGWWSASAVDVNGYGVYKGAEYRQAGTNAPVPLSRDTFQFFSFADERSTGSVNGVSLRLYNGALRVLTNESGRFQFTQAFTNATVFNTVYPPTNYLFMFDTLNDGRTNSILKLSPNAYPNTPRIANWPAAQLVEAADDFSLTWDPFVGGSTNDLISLWIVSTNGEQVFETNNLPPSSTAITVPALTLAYDQRYTGILLFINVTAVNTNNLPGVPGSVGYFKKTQFPMATLTAPPAAGRLHFSAPAYSASENGGSANVTVVRSGGSSGSVTVDLAVTNGTAKAGLDYVATSGPVTFVDGQTTAAVSIPLLDDFIREGNEQFSLTLRNPTGGAVLGSISNAAMTIVDNERAGAGTLTFSAAAYTISETGRLAVISVLRTNGSLGAVGVDFRVSPGSATASLDYTSASGTLTFAAGQVSRSFTIPIYNDPLIESNETVLLALENPAGGASLGRTNAVLTIVDDDFVYLTPTVATVNPGATVQFDVAVRGTQQTVVWSVNGVAGGNALYGTISSSGLYTAPAAVPTNNVVWIKAVSVAYPAKSALARVNVVPREPPYFVESTAFSLPANYPVTIALTDGTSLDNGTDQLIVFMDAATTLDQMTAVATVLSNCSARVVGSIPVLRELQVQMADTTQSSNLLASLAAISGVLYAGPNLMAEPDQCSPTGVHGVNWAAANNLAVPAPTAGNVIIGILDCFDPSIGAAGPGSSKAHGEVVEAFARDAAGAALATNVYRVAQTCYMSQHEVLQAAADFVKNHPGKRIVFNASMGARGNPNVAAHEAWYAGFKFLVEAINKQFGDRVIFVKSGGNANITMPFNSRIMSCNFVAVGGLDESSPTNATKAYFSNVGPVMSVYAPACGVTPDKSFGSEVFDGTSYSAPQVTGQLAALWAKYPSLSGCEIAGELNNLPTVNGFRRYNGKQLETQIRALLPTLSVRDAAVTEGNSGTRNMPFTVTLSKASASTVTVGYSTVAGSAAAGVDFWPAYGTLTFAPGQLTKTFPVTIVGDTTVETDESFRVTLSNPINATIADGQGVGVIVDDDDYRVFVGDAGAAGVGLGSCGGCGLSTSLSLGSPVHFQVYYNPSTGKRTATVSGWVDSTGYSSLSYTWQGQLNWNGVSYTGNLLRTDNADRPAIALTATRDAQGRYVVTAAVPFTYRLYLLDGSCTGPLQTYNYQVNRLVLNPRGW